MQCLLCKRVFQLVKLSNARRHHQESCKKIHRKPDKKGFEAFYTAKVLKLTQKNQKGDKTIFAKTIDDVAEYTRTNVLSEMPGGTAARLRLLHKELIELFSEEHSQNQPEQRLELYSIFIDNRTSYEKRLMRKIEQKERAIRTEIEQESNKSPSFTHRFYLG